jgi:hypothetical protein
MILDGFKFRDLLTRFLNKSRLEKYDMTICCIVKDENIYLKEWIEYHLKIGVQHFYIYDNDSKVPVSETLRETGLAEVATVINVSGRAKQVVAYNDCLIRNRANSKWIGFIDADEYIVPKSTKGDLRALLKDFEEFGGLGINWLVFGSNGHTKRTNLPQLQRFVMRSEESFPVNRHVKVIVQTKYVKRSIGAHLFSFVAPYSAVNEMGKKITTSYSDVSVEKIQINHYYCRSLEEYKDKVNRGLADTSRGRRQLDNFFDHDREANRVEDRTILNLLSTL